LRETGHTGVMEMVAIVGLTLVVLAIGG